MPNETVQPDSTSEFVHGGTEHSVLDRKAQAHGEQVRTFCEPEATAATSRTVEGGVGKNGTPATWMDGHGLIVHPSIPGFEGVNGPSQPAHR